MLPQKFTAEIQKSPNKGGWTYVVWPESATVFGTHGAVKVKGKVDNKSFQSSFMVMGDGVHMLPVKRDILKAIDKNVGDTVEVIIEERL
jgi:hypothetical protein